MRILKRLWNSPTFTTWGKQGAEALRLFAVTPLILIQFDTTEIAAWYLFGSLMFFGGIVHGGISLTFSRMIAFGMGGATDLAPIEDGIKKQRGSGAPNWEVIARAYGTIGALNMALAVMIGLVTAGMGYYGLERMVSAHPQPAEIWAAFGIILVSNTVITIFRKYEVTLRGMNYVVLINRWGTLFSLLSVVSGFFALSAGANVWQLALTMQIVLLLDVIRMRILLFTVEEGRARSFPPQRFDKEVLSWAWPPFWRGLVTSFSQEGVIQFALVTFARHGDPAVVASFLFSYRMLRVIGRVCNAPFSSHMPKFSRLIASGETERLRSLLSKQIFRSQALLAASILVGGTVLTFGLHFLDTNIVFIDFNIWLVLGSIFLVYRFSIMTRATFNLANNFPFLKLELFAGLIALGLTLQFVPSGNVWAVVLCPLLPSVALITVQAVKRSARFLEISSSNYLRSTSGYVFSIYFLIAFLYIFLQEFVQ